MTDEKKGLPDEEQNPPLADPGPRDNTEATEDESWPEPDKT